MGELDWPGARNLRDLGGRALRDGGVTAPGRVFRSGAPEYLTDEGWRQAQAAGLRTVIDLRNAPAETGRAPDHPAIRPESLSGLVFIPAPTEDPGDAEFLRVCGPWLDHPRSWADNARLAPARITAVMRAIASADGAVLVHCAGGRDRTGMICAMLLDLAGATATPSPMTMPTDGVAPKRIQATAWSTTLGSRPGASSTSRLSSQGN